MSGWKPTDQSRRRAREDDPQIRGRRTRTRITLPPLPAVKPWEWLIIPTWPPTLSVKAYREGCQSQRGHYLLGRNTGCCRRAGQCSPTCIHIGFRSTFRCCSPLGNDRVSKDHGVNSRDKNTCSHPGVLKALTLTRGLKLGHGTTFKNPLIPILLLEARGERRQKWV